MVSIRAADKNPARYSSSDPGFEALSLDDVLAVHEGLLGRIKLCYGADRASFERELMPLVRGYAAYVHLLPATSDNYFHTPGGLLQLGLETAFFSLQGTDAHIFSGRATILQRRELEPRWRTATFIGGLCCELHRVLSHLIVTTPDGEEWPAFLSSLFPWLRQRGVGRYFLRWRPNAVESRGLSLFALPYVVSPEVLQQLCEGNSIIVPQLMASVAGVPQYREHNVLDELVRRSLALVIDRNLLANADRYGAPQYGSHLERYLVDALRRLAAGHSAWTPNRDKSRLWLGADGVFLVWPGAAHDVLVLLEGDQLAGIPKAPETLLDILLSAGVFVASSEGARTWSILPPGAKTATEAVKLASPSIVLAGIEPTPQALPAALVAPATTSAAAGADHAKVGAVSDDTTPSAQASTVTPAPAPAAPPAKQPTAAASIVPAQLSLIEVAPPPTPPTQMPPNPTFGLSAPLRLNPAVRDALTSILDSLNDGPAASTVFTVTEGVFVPLSEFERRGVQPSIAIRALLDTAMLARNDRTGPPTVSRAIGPTTIIGVVVAPKFVAGLDPRAFAPHID